MKSGPRNRRIIVQRQFAALDGYGGEVSTWADYATLFAQVIFGTGQERREAAQENASAPATFRVLHSRLTAAITAEDRIQFDDGQWDITSVVPLGLNEGIEITATKAVP